MALSPIYYARGDSNNANNSELNVRPLAQYPVTEIRFTSGTSGDLVLDQLPDSITDPDLLPQPDPDTQVIIGGQSYNFIFLKSGTLEPARVPSALANDPVYVIKVDMNNDGDFDDADDVQIFFTTSPDGTPGNMRDIQGGALEIGNLAVIPPSVPVCFCSSTDIATPSGPRKVETLLAGDMVLTDTGEAKQVMWIGRTRYSPAVLRQNPNLRPIVIPANAMGSGLPADDLHISPQHRIVLQSAACELLFGTDTVLVPAKFLVGTLAEVAPVTGAVDYFHILLEDHDMLVSNGLPTESFQPARRTIDVMDEACRMRLEAQIEALGADSLLTRKDRHLSLHRQEAKVLIDRLQRIPVAQAAISNHCAHL